MSRRGPFFIIFILVVLFFSRTIAKWVIDYHWWNEMGQLETWWLMWMYDPLPSFVAALIAFIVLFTVHARAMKAARTGLGQHPAYFHLSNVALLFISWVAAKFCFSAKTIQMFAASSGVSNDGWKDPIFGHSLKFYLFEYPFYSSLLSFLMTVVFLGVAIHIAAGIFWVLQRQFKNRIGEQFEVQPSAIFEGIVDSGMLRGAVAFFLICMAGQSYLGRYRMLYEPHPFMTGMDYVADHIRLPLVVLMMGALLLAAAAVLIGRYKAIVIVPAFMLLQTLVPNVVNSFYVKPNEISLQKMYVQYHLEATRSAYGLDKNSKSMKFDAHPEGNIDAVKNKALLSNVRLWDWRAFHDTITQIQPLRPYAFQDTDVDRYMIEGKLRQVLLSARELDMQQLGDARNGWPNTHVIYTHGYGVVAADANHITSDGLPNLFIHDAPPKITVPGLQLTRPEIYYGEAAHEPVFVRSKQKEFNYPSGSENVHSKYDGTGGFPIDNWLLRLTASVYYGDFNILLTSYLEEGSRMMIHRRVRERVTDLADFLSWDADPYLVLTKDGRLVWMIDGYTTSSEHPYSQRMVSDELGRINYIRNSVKATVDAYTGETNLYIFDKKDPIIQANKRLFPKLFKEDSEMPADMRAHARYPEGMFAVQAQLFLSFHMTDPESFYNKADIWDTARETTTAAGQPRYMAPSFQIANLPGETEPEFLLTVPFTPKGKDNLLGMMVARCDGDKLGELVFVELPKQELFYGPMQIEARLNQDQIISKDLTLWNQQGSQVLNGQMQVLPIDGTFLYIQPLYLQASQAKMPQMKKVVMAIGNRMAYADSYEQTLAEIAGLRVAVKESAQAGEAPKAGQPAMSVVQLPAAKIDAMKRHMKRYRDLMGQGKWAEAGKELEALEGELR